MTTLVTGGAGYIGSHMVLELLDAGEKVVVLDNLTTGSRSAVPCGAAFVYGDAGNVELVRNVIRKHGIDAIIHFAGSVIVPDSVADPLGYYHNNTVKSRALIEAAVSTGVHKFIFSSTAAVYGMPETSPVAETAPVMPISPYGWSKLMTEQMLKDASAAHDFRFLALRYFNVAGADPLGRSGQSTPRATHLIKAACQTALGFRRELEVFGTDFKTRDGSGVRDYIQVSDLARAHSAAHSHLRNGGPSGVYNCGYGKGFSVLEVIRAVKKASGSDFAVKLAGRRAGDPAEIVADSSRLSADLGWQPRFSGLDAIVEQALAWEARIGEMRATG